MALTLEEILQRRNKILDEFLQSLGTSLKEIRIKALKEFITTTEGWGHQNLAEYIEKIIDDLIIGIRRNKDNLDIQAFENYITDAQNLIEDIGIEELDYEKPKYGLSPIGPKQDLADLIVDLQYGMFPDDVRNMDIEKRLDNYKNSNNKTDWLADEIYNLSGPIANDEANTSMRHVMPESWEFRQLVSNGPKLIEHFEEGIASGKYTLEDVDNIFKNIEVSSYMKPVDGTVLGQYKQINNFADYKDVFYNYFLPDFYKKADEYINGTGDSFRVFNNRESVMLDNYNVYVGFGNPETPYNQVWKGFGEAILTPEFQRRAADEMISYNTTDATLPLSPEDLGKHNKLVKELREEYADLMTDALVDIQSGYGDDIVVKQDVSKLRNAGVSEESIVIKNIDNIGQRKPIVTDTPTNVVGDLAKQNELINNFVNSMNTEGNLEFYVKHSGTKVPASSIQYNPRIGIGSQIPGFYTEPLGIRDIKAMGGRGGPNAISNYYKVQVNSNNLLISAGGGKVTGLKSPISSVGYANLGNEIEKIDWKIFEQETGLSWENDFNGKGLFSVENGQKYLGSDSQGFIRRLRGMGLTDDQISSALRKSGIEGFVSGPTNKQYEVVLLDPNDELGIGKNINVQDATETDFVNNQSKVNQIDELIIDTPTNVVGDKPPNQTQRVSGETGLSTHSDRIRKVAQDYHKIMGYSDPDFKPAMVFNDEVGAIAADIFEQLPMFDDNAIPYYKKFIQETNMQYQKLLDAGMKFEVVDGDPYTPNRVGHQQMIADMENGVLKVLATESGFGDEATSKLNPMLAESIYTDVNGRVMLENDVFRAVHDTFGHGMRGNTFGPIGEYNAWLAHKEMYSPDARRIMTTETLGQNTYTNYGQHMRDVDGNLIKVGDPNYIKPADRPFAPQKVALMPEEIINVASTVVEDASELVDTDSLNKLKELANAEPEVVDNIFKSAKKVVGRIFNTVAGVLDPGDVAITAGITQLLPRLGAAAIAPGALAAYVGYELSILAIDAGQALNKARVNQGLGTVAEAGGAIFGGTENADWRQLGKDTWQEFGEVSDTWSLSWKISEPIIDYAFEQYGKLQESR